MVAVLLLAGEVLALSFNPRIKLPKPARVPFGGKQGALGPVKRTVSRSSVEEPVPSSPGGRDAAMSKLEDLVVNAKSLLRGRSEGGNTFVRNVLSGFTVSLAMIPEAVAFAFVAGVSPLVGLWSTVVLNLFATLLGGRPGICSSASGACSVVIAALVASHGPTYLSGCVLLAGLLQCLAGVGGLGKFIRLVPHPVMLGFVNGLAIVMTRAQLTHFCDPATGAILSGVAAQTMFGLTALTMALVKLTPKVTKALPPSLVSVAIVTAVTHAFNLPARTLVDIAGSETFRGGLSVLPTLCIPALPWLSAPFETLGIIAPYAITMAAVGLIESLLTMQLIDGIVDDGTRGSTRKECFGQGVGNIASGLTSGMGGCALLGQSLINVDAGGTSRVSGIALSLFLATGIVATAPLLGQVPIAALVGVMLLVCQATFSWSSLRVMRKIPKIDALVILLVSFVTVKEDLAKAVVAGTICSALGFAWKQSTNISATLSRSAVPAGASAGTEAAWKTYNVRGPLFFGSTQAFNSLFDVKGDGDDVVIDFLNSRVYDHSALEAINSMADRYGALGKRVHLRHLSSDCSALLERIQGSSLPPYEIVESDPATDPVYEVAEDPAVYRDVPLPPSS